MRKEKVEKVGVRGYGNLEMGRVFISKENEKVGVRFGGDMETWKLEGGLYK